MNINVALIDKLIRLRNGYSLPASKLRGEWVEDLLRDGILISRSHGCRRIISASDVHQLEQSLVHLDERLGNLERTRSLLTNSYSRAEQASSSGNSKLTPIRSCPGFPVNSYEPNTCQLNGKKFIVSPDEGSFLFVTDWKQFAIPKDVVVVGIENMENFRLIRWQEHLFSSLIPHKHILFVSRYPQSTDLHTWLKRIPNEYYPLW